MRTRAGLLELHHSTLKVTLEEMKYLIFSFFGSVSVARGGVEFRHSTCLPNSAESGQESVFNGTRLS